MVNIIKKLLNVKTVKIKNIKTDNLKNIVAFELEPTKGQQFRCTICGKKAEYYDKGKGLRHWRALDLGTTQILIESEAPRVKCKIHGVHTAKVPWARHITAILNTAKYKLSNARIEAMNNKIKLTIRMAYGFRNIGNMIDMIMLRCSHIPIFLPGRTFLGSHLLMMAQK